MKNIYACPLEKLNDVIKQSKAQTLLCLTGPDQEIAKPNEITDGFVNLVFNDITQPIKNMIEPQQEHIEMCIQFAQQWNRQNPIICCCWMGVSRSSAAVAIICATLYPELEETAIANNIRNIAPFVNPNLLMIEIADKQLGRKGKLLNAFAQLPPPAQTSIGIPYCVNPNEWEK